MGDSIRLSVREVVGRGRKYVCVVITYSKGKDQPGKVANLARGQLNRENEYPPVPVVVRA